MMKHPYDTRDDEIRPSLKEMGGWTLQLERLHRRIAPRFARPEPRHRALLYLQAILSEIPRKNGWQVAEHAQQAQPYGIQRLLSTAVWDQEGVRDDLRAFVLEELGSQGAIGVLDESGFPKRGNKSAGVKNQYCGVSGRVENCQVGVFLSYVTPRGHALIDRDLYVPQDWLTDRQRCQQAGIAESLAFAPKWELALHLLERAVKAGVRFEWVVADSVYGQAVHLRQWLEGHQIAYGMGIPCDEAVCVKTPNGFVLAEAREIEATVIQEPDWSRLSQSQGTKGPRLFDWAIVPLMHQATVDGRHFLLIRRCLDNPDTKAFFLVFAPPAATLEQIVEALGNRWHIEEDLQASKDLGLDHYEVRCFIGWYRHVTLVMLAYAFLVSVRVHDTSHLPQRVPSQHAGPPQPLVPLTTSEIRHLLSRLFFPLPSHAGRIQAWSSWRRQHQFGARSSHHKQREKRSRALGVARDG